jgi:HTH-type transcriptional regulator / antitoxin HipB
MLPIGKKIAGHMDASKTSAAEIGRYVRQRRIASKVTQRSLAELAGVGTRVISELERGKPTLRMDVVNKVLYVFGKMLSWGEAPRENGDHESA